ncbi:MAG: hypothetical protein QXK76_03955 [Candidatus Woesearchaeota archaeon]
MNRKTIDSIIDAFEYAYEKNKSRINNIDLDKFIKLSEEYVDENIYDNYENKCFKEYFREYVKSLYRKDFEKQDYEKEMEYIHLIKKNSNYLNIAWGLIAGSAGGSLGYIISDSSLGFIVGSLLGVAAGLKFSSSMTNYKNIMKSTLGTKEFEKNIREKLYSKLSS